MKPSRVTIRELVLVMAIVVPAFGWLGERVRSDRFRHEAIAARAASELERANAAAELDDASATISILRAKVAAYEDLSDDDGATIAELRAKLAECLDRHGEAE